jgi:hypothetical protein
LQLDMLGLKYRYLSNYPGSNEARLAMEKKEIELYPESLPTYRTAVEPMVGEGKVIPLWHDALPQGDDFVRSPDAEGIPAPTYPEFLKQQKGAYPTGPMWQAYTLINTVGTTFLRSVVLPPNSPKEAELALREAFGKITTDPEFIAETQKILKFSPRYLVDDATEKLYREKLTKDPAVAAFMQDYIEKGRQSLGK